MHFLYSLRIEVRIETVSMRKSIQLRIESANRFFYMEPKSCSFRYEANRLNH